MTATTTAGQLRAKATKARLRALNRPLGDPVTSERDYSDEEREFLSACDRFHEQYQQPFLTACEYLWVAKGMGYKRDGEA